MLGVEEFAAALRRLLAIAGSRRLNYADINAGERHRRIGGYPGAYHRLPSCCRAVHIEMRGIDELRSVLPTARVRR